MPIKKAGLLKTTLIDYPGKIASSIFLPGCNMRCPYCHNRDLVLNRDKTLVDIDEILAFLSKRKNIFQGVCISGGEPLIHEDLPALAGKLRALSLKIKLDTNGLLPERIFAVEPDYIAMDIKTSPSKYCLLAGSETGSLSESDYNSMLRESVTAIIKSGIEHEFRTTLVPGIVTLEDMAEIADIAKGCMKYTLNKFVPENTIDENYRRLTPYSEESYNELSQQLEKKGIKAVFRGF